MRKIFIITQILILFFCSACSQPLRTLMRVTKEQDAQAKYISVQEKKFKVLIRDIEEQRIRIGYSKQHCIKRYGEPIRENQEEGQVVLLYRRPRDFFPSQKVYLYFDQKGLLKKWDHYQKEPDSPSQ